MSSSTPTISTSSRKTDKVNKAFQLVPELRSKYAAYPMTGNTWLKPSDKVPGSGQKGFIAHAKPKAGEAALKPDYVFGPGTRGFGYYHMLTKEAYVILTPRLQSESSPKLKLGRLFGRGKDKSTESSKELLKLACHVVYHRSKSPVPNDAEASKYGVSEYRYETYYTY